VLVIFSIYWIEKSQDKYADKLRISQTKCRQKKPKAEQLRTGVDKGSAFIRRVIIIMFMGMEACEV